MQYIAYYRLSKKRKNGEQYGILAQKDTVSHYLTTVPDSQLIASFEEIETGANDNRPQLKAALELAKTKRAVLVIAKLDRLSRNAAFLLTLQNSGCDFVCCDMPNADRFTIGILALVAQRERELISARTKAGLAVARKTKKLGCPVAKEAWSKALVTIQERKLLFAQTAFKSIEEIRSTGVTSLSRISEFMNKRGEKTARGGRWTTTAVKRVLTTVT